jgi:sugar transferase (PEP-CTERM/EpsH1 system associated)
MDCNDFIQHSQRTNLLDQPSLYAYVPNPMPPSILFICHRIPYPPNKGEKIRSYNMLRYLCRRHEVSLAFLIDDRRDEAHVETLRPMVKTLHYDRITPRVKKLRSSLSLLSKRPISVPYFYTTLLQSQIDALLDQQNFDCIFCSSSPTAEYVFRSRHFSGKLQRTRKVMDFIDMDSYKWRQYAEKARFPMRWIYACEARYLLSYEAKIADTFQQVFFVSEAEKNLFLDQIPCNHISAVGNGVDLNFFDPSHQSPVKKNGPTLVFTGAMDYPPNVDGITWFTKTVYPLIQKKIPNLNLYIVGSHPAPIVQRLAQQDGIIVTGFVRDVRDYLAAADICIIPLRIARGIQNKVLEAMAMGKATVCTPQALEGINAIPDVHVMTASDEKSLAAHVITLLSDANAASHLGKQARRFVEENYTWNARLAPLDAI